MAAAAGQAAGMAVGAAVGSFAGQPVAGAAIGSSIAGGLQQRESGRIQDVLDDAALRLNQEQARVQAAEKSAVHARQFRQALATQVALASFRSGGGSIARQVGAESLSNFLQDQEAIQTGLDISETQGAIQKANLSANTAARDIKIVTRTAAKGFEGLNLNLLKPKD